MRGGAQTYWVGGRVVDGRPRYARPWRWLVSLAVFVLLADLILTLRLGPPAYPGEHGGSETGEVRELRARLAGLAAAASEGRRAILLLGDSVLAGDVLAEAIEVCADAQLSAELAELRGCESLRGVDWRAARVLEQMRAELAPDSDAYIAQVALDGMLPVDVLHVLAELDRVDPRGEVEVLFEINMRYFSAQYAEQFGCTRASLCELGRVAFTPHALGNLALANALELVDSSEDWLHARIPLRRHRQRLSEVLELSFIESLAGPKQPPIEEEDEQEVETEGEKEQSARAGFERRRAQAQARVAEHYRSARLDGQHAQFSAVIQIVEQLRGRGRRGTLFTTPIDDTFVADTTGFKALARRHEKLARTINDISLREGVVPIQLVHLDHPLFETSAFLDHVHLRPDGNRLLALNLLHELGLPLARRPFEWMMVHGEDHDRTLIHRRGEGKAEGGAWEVLLARARGVASARDGSRVVIADTNNHVLRQLRGNMQMVERLAGRPGRKGSLDGPALQGARLRSPRSPVIEGESVYFIDGKKEQHLRVLQDDVVRTLDWVGPSCPVYDVLDLGRVDERLWAYLLCSDDRIIAVELAKGRGRLLLDPRAPLLADATRRYLTLTSTNDQRLLFADGDSKIWSIPLRDNGESAAPELVFANEGAALIPNGPGLEYPFSFEEMRCERIVSMEWVERYGLLLVADQHSVGPGANKRLQRQLTERVHLRAFDLERGEIYPWIKALPHGEAFHMWNARTQNFVSYFHLGAMAIAQDDASLFWLERKRSRLLRIADGLLGVHKSGNLHTEAGAIELMNPVAGEVTREVGLRMRPDRFLSWRHEPTPHAGPYVIAQFGSSLSTMSDRLGNYSLARLIELELQAELGYRDRLRVDLFQRSDLGHDLQRGNAALRRLLEGEGPAPDVILFELHDLGGRFTRRLSTPAQRERALAELAELAARHDSLLLLYDNSAMASEGRDGLRASSPGLRELIAAAKAMGIVVLEPSDWLLRELLRDSPWGSQPFDEGEHNGATWAVERSARAFGAMAAPLIRAHLRGRVPARMRLAAPQQEAG